MLRSTFRAAERLQAGCKGGAWHRPRRAHLASGGVVVHGAVLLRKVDARLIGRLDQVSQLPVRHGRRLVCERAQNTRLLSCDPHNGQEFTPSPIAPGESGRLASAQSTGQAHSLAQGAKLRTGSLSYVSAGAGFALSADKASARAELRKLKRRLWCRGLM
jgi:hypothetical protein